MNDIHTYMILKEIDGEFVPVGKEFKGTVDEVNAHLAELTEAEGGCYAADSGQGEKSES